MQRSLGQVKKGVARDCRKRGCLRLKEILTLEMLKDANFLKLWKGDCKTRQIMFGDEDMRMRKRKSKVRRSRKKMPRNS